jgi:hypothetical protein
MSFQWLSFTFFAVEELTGFGVSGVKYAQQRFGEL